MQNHTNTRAMTCFPYDLADRPVYQVLFECSDRNAQPTITVTREGYVMLIPVNATTGREAVHYMSRNVFLGFMALPLIKAINERV